ncbi:MAG: phosphate-binding protein [Verrucomicrobia bacterium CAG:312_58_20]|nr:MAG: phosphate-binding protein [Verrucomicrobia bacterium CAG:312_58_20]PWL69752.1 MAG: phosphate-binding protein [Verrucomicrobiota bacterium]
MKKTIATTMTLIALAAAAFTSAPAMAEKNIVIDGSTTVGPIAKAFADYYKEKTGIGATISESGSGNGVKSLINGACDIANMSRFMKDSEFKTCVEKGILPVAHVVAFDGLAVVVNPANKVGALTMAQLADIYTGKIRNWKELGGDDAEIVVISRDTNSGTYETFNELVLRKNPVVKGAEYVGSNGQAKTRVASTKNAIAYVGLGFADDSVKTLSVDGILPSPKTIVSGKYPIARPLFMFTNKYPKMGTPVYDFVTLHLSEEGREIVRDLGYVPVAE